MGIINKEAFVLVARVSKESNKKMSYFNFEKGKKEYFSRNIKFNDEFPGFEK